MLESDENAGVIMQIREYSKQDVTEMAALFYNTVHTVNAKDYTPQQLNAWATNQVDIAAWNRSFLTNYTLVAVHDGVLVGFGDMDSTGYLDHLFVHSQHQGKGIATMLCDGLEPHFPVTTITTHASITAKPFFESRGYVVVRQQQIERRGVLLTNFVMQKKMR